MKPKNTEITYHTFNDRKYSRIIKNTLEKSIYLCKLKLIDNHKDAVSNNKIILRTLKQIIRNPVVYENDMIYIALNQIELFLEFLTDFKESIAKVSNEEGIRERHNSYYQNQKILLIHLMEILENPHKMPSFIIKS